jgi:hypothetical protein
MKDELFHRGVMIAGMIYYPCPRLEGNSQDIWTLQDEKRCIFCQAVLVPPEAPK